MSMSFRIIQGERLSQFSAPHPGQSSSALKGGDGGGTFGDMEARVAALEAHMENVRENVGLIRTDVRDTSKQVAELKTNLATLTQTVERLPTKEWGVKAVVALGALVSVLMVLNGAVSWYLSPHALPAATSNLPTPAAKP